MTTDLVLGDVDVEVVRKDIRNLHLSVHPPSGRVRIAAPLRMADETIRVFAVSKLPWIRAQRRKLQRQEREPRREYLERESHYVWGARRTTSDLWRSWTGFCRGGGSCGRPSTNCRCVTRSGFTEPLAWKA